MFTVGKKFIFQGVEVEVRANVDGEFVVFKCPSFDFSSIYKGFTIGSLEYARRHGDLVDVN